MQTGLELAEWAFILLGIALNWFFWNRGFYTLPKEEHLRTPFLKFKDVLALFFIYITALFFMPPFLALLPAFKRLPYLESTAWIQAVTMGGALLLLYSYALSIDSLCIKTICRGGAPKRRHPLLSDIACGALVWFLSFPIMSLLGAFFEKLINTLFQYQSAEQVAVRYLKMALSNPFLLAVALLTILLISPIVEEFLFRGVLQTYLKQHLGRRSALLLASFLFALCHLAPTQGLGNIPLIFSLFVFALFLGFLYEKRQSLFASIALHMTFNAVSAFRVLFFQEGA